MLVQAAVSMDDHLVSRLQATGYWTTMTLSAALSFFFSCILEGLTEDVYVKMLNLTHLEQLADSVSN